MDVNDLGHMILETLDVTETSWHLMAIADEFELAGFPEHAKRFRHAKRNNMRNRHNIATKILQRDKYATVASSRHSYMREWNDFVEQETARGTSGTAGGSEHNAA